MNIVFIVVRPSIVCIINNKSLMLELTSVKIYSQHHVCNVTALMIQCCSAVIIHESTSASKISKHPFSDKPENFHVYRFRFYIIIFYRYCHSNYDPEKEDSREVYLCLIRMYLSPPNLADYGIRVPEGSQPEPNVDDALRVLMSHHHVIDTAKVSDY